MMKIHAATAFLLVVFGAPGLRAAEGEAGLPVTAAAPESRGSAGFSESDSEGFDFDAQVAREVKQFYLRLRSQYGYAPASDQLEAFQQGAPALTQDALRMALQSSRAASAEILRLADSMADRLDGRDSRSFLQDGLRIAFERDSERLGQLAWQIEKDEYLRLLDRGRPQESILSVSASSPQAARSALAQLKRLAEQLEHSLADALAEDLTQVVSVRELSQPSVRSLSRGIRRLADSIRSAAPKL